ncbi:MULTISPECIES: NAD(P)-dependent oxidoreductase [unclassified Polaromonas]|uniref:NAD-dependent epimerase/dehydratase family protein n=1 Tax=unclassified Polaromonas TaxID=2638319 RepID=UPI0018CB88E2|nr:MULTISPECIES: NAD(P)-dependent oxidoreductase [unclassified Polaromonas]MBG6072394.1 nucleoside-diphosphate-sugar epimerase [Polaromonas sp. CG_9.7]MBG6114398.1 nucleoside-diphosphate-sugar epimerase [Polaromonas sp. CG_9.2]
MKVLVIGGSGYIGKRLLEIISTIYPDKLTGASRGLELSNSSTVAWIKLDTCNVYELTSVLKGFDAVVNCVAGNAKSISQGAHALKEAAIHAGYPRIVHLSTMSVYGSVEGNIREDAHLNPNLGWYSRSKFNAEQHIREYALKGGEAVILRPGCVFGPNSELWVGRIARWLQSGRLGDLGVHGDGWSNLVYVDDVCQAIIAALKLPIEPKDVPTFNLAAPDSPRWNTYFIDLAIGLKFTPVKRINRRQLQLDCLIAGPPLKLAQMIFKRLRSNHAILPDYMPPGLMGLFAQHIHLDSIHASQELGMIWTDYITSLNNSQAWASNSVFSMNLKDRAICMH